MNESRHYSAGTAMLLTASLLFGASAFADSRHPKTTGSPDRQRATVDRGRSAAPVPAVTQRAGVPEPAPVLADRSDRRGEDRSDSTATTSNGHGQQYSPRRGGDERQGHGQRGPSGNASQGRSGNHGSPAHASAGGHHQGKRAPYYAEGRISKAHAYGNGYRVWVAGSPYPFYVPAAYYHQGHFNVGLTVRVGGYYNAGGYYDYYGDYACDAIPGERLRGFVESIDPYRGTFVLELEGRRGYVTIFMHERCEPVRYGDFVVVYGQWNRHGRFVAGDVDVVRGYR